MKPHRYNQAALAVPGAEAKAYSPAKTPAAKPEQGWLLFNNGGQLGPLFNTQEGQA